MECADVDMGLCVSQFSGAPLDDQLPPSSPSPSHQSRSPPAWKGEPGIENEQYRVFFSTSEGVHRSCHVRQQWAARKEVRVARAPPHRRYLRLHNSYKTGRKNLIQKLVLCLTLLSQAAQALLLIPTGKYCLQILHQQHQCCTNYPAPKQSDTRWFSQMSAQPPLLLFSGQIPFLHTKVEQTPPAHLHKFIKLLRIHLLLPPQVAGKQDTVKVLRRSRLR
jgi:hypothetical protein